jgi:hypothetical protein
MRTQLNCDTVGQTALAGVDHVDWQCVVVVRVTSLCGK